jgi:hypothetical protein
MTMKKYLLFSTAFIAGFCLQAQNFQKAISIPFVATPAPKSVVQCSDGGYLIGTGSNYLSPSNSCIIKTDATGQVTWTKSIGSGTYNNLIQAGECAGGYFVFGENNDSVWSNSGFSVTKLDVNGNMIWAKVYSNTFPAYGTSRIRPTSDGGFLISESLSAKMGALKIDGNGNVLWHTAFSDDPNDQSPKCPSFDCFINNDGSMIFSGKRNSDILLVKADANGQMQWSSTIGNQSSYYHANAVAATADGGYIVGGYADFTPFAMKVTSTGAVSWYHAYNTNSNTSNGGEFIQMKELANGNFIALGTEYYSGTFVAVLSPNGSVVSSSIFGDPTATNGESLDYPGMCATSDGGFAITGLYSEPYGGLTALSIMKTDANGNFPCEFNYYPMTFLASQLAPSVLNVPIYSIPQLTTVGTMAPVITNLSVTETDFCLLFSTNDQDANAISMNAYPSPVAEGENLNLNVSGVQGDATIAVYDANGRIVTSFSSTIITNGTIEISTAGFASGIYMVRMTGTNENLLGTTRFIVK